MKFKIEIAHEILQSLQMDWQSTFENYDDVFLSFSLGNSPCGTLGVII